MKLTSNDLLNLFRIHYHTSVTTMEIYQNLIENELIDVEIVTSSITRAIKNKYTLTDKGRKHIQKLSDINIDSINGERLTNAEVLKKLMLNEYRQRWDELSRGIVYPGAKVTYETLINNLEQGKTKLPGEVRGRYADYLKLDFIEGWYSTVKVNGADELLVIVRLETELFLRMNTSKWGTKEFTTMKFMPYSDMKPIKLEEL